MGEELKSQRRELLESAEKWVDKEMKKILQKLANLHKSKRRKYNFLFCCEGGCKFVKQHHVESFFMRFTYFPIKIPLFFSFFSVCFHFHNELVATNLPAYGMVWKWQKSWEFRDNRVTFEKYVELTSNIITQWTPQTIGTNTRSESNFKTISIKSLVRLINNFISASSSTKLRNVVLKIAKLQFHNFNFTPAVLPQFFPLF